MLTSHPDNRESKHLEVTCQLWAPHAVAVIVLQADPYVPLLHQL